MLKVLCMISAAMILPVGLATPVLAQTESSSGELTDIVVTAQRRDQRLKDVPIFVTAFSSEALEKRGVDQLFDYLQATPSTFLRQAGDPRYTKLSIRGVKTNIQLLAGSAVGFHLNEFKIAPSGPTDAVDFDLIDIDLVDALRGPQGKLFGRNGSGGAINVTTTKPNYEQGGYVKAQHTRFDEVRLGRVIDMTLMGGKLAIRATSEIRRGGQFIENIGPGNSSAGGYNRFRIALRAEPTKSLLIDLSYARLGTSQDAYDAVSTGIISDYVLSFVDAPVLGGFGVVPANKGKIATSDSTQNDVVANIVTAKFQLELGDVMISSVTGYIERTKKSASDIDYSIEEWFRSIAGDNYDSLSQEIRAAYQPSERLLLSAGYISARDNALSFRSEIGETLGAVVYDQIARDEGAPVGGIQSGDVWLDYQIGSRNKSNGLFAEAVWNATDRRTHTLSARQTWDESSPYGFKNFLGFVDTFPTERRNFSAFTPRVVAQYALSEDSNIYGSISTGYKAGGTDVFASLQGFASRYGAEKLTSYEIGTKNLFFDRRLPVNLAAFVLDWGDILVEADIFRIKIC
jgi:iron complex outermembrane recepter protein